MEHNNPYSTNENSYASKGVGNTALGLSIGALAGELLGGGLGNILGGGRGGCSENNCVNRYELGLQQELASKDTKIALLESNIYTDTKITEAYKELNSKISCLEGQIAQQAVYNATVNGTMSCLQGQISQLMGLTKLVVPNSSICPGWGEVTTTIATSTTT